MTDIDERWRLAKHEAGHTAATLILGGVVKSVVLTNDGDGATDAKGLNATDKAFAVAAGPEAERQLQHVPAPAVKPLSIETPRDCPTSKNSLAYKSTSAKLSPLQLSDEQRIASWAVVGFESDPDRWAPRVHWARSEAEAIVRHHARLIVTIATALFERSILSGNEINQLVKDHK